MVPMHGGRRGSYLPSKSVPGTTMSEMDEAEVSHGRGVEVLGLGGLSGDREGEES